MSSISDDTAVDEILDAARSLANRREWDRAIDLLTDANRREPDTRLETTLVRYRHRAFGALAEATGPDDWPAPTRDRFPGAATLPEIDATELDAAVVSSAIAHHGSLLVRGLFDPTRAAELRESIDGAFEGAAIARERPLTRTPPWYVPFKPSDEYEFGGLERSFAQRGSGVLCADAPRALFQLIEGIRSAGIDRVVGDYFGERPAISVKKTTLRRTEPDVVSGWHQDGAFLGTGTRTLNIWTAMSPCGDDAPSLDVVHHHFDQLVETGGEGALFDWSVSDANAARHGAEKVVRPVFDTGDALVFDHMTLHRTGVGPEMTRTRYAVETWFFAPSTYPHDQIPVLL